MQYVPFLVSRRIHQRLYQITPQSFNEIFRGYEERTGTKLDVTYRTADSLRAKLSENANDFDAYLHLIWVTNGLVGEPDNGLFPEWNPTKVVDILAPRT